MRRRPPRSTPLYSSAASDVYKRQVHTAQRADAGQVGDRIGLAVTSMKNTRPLRVIALAQRRKHRDALDPLAGVRDALGGGARPIVIDADHRRAVSLHIGRQT